MRLTTPPTHRGAGNPERSLFQTPPPFSGLGAPLPCLLPGRGRWVPTFGTYVEKEHCACERRRPRRARAARGHAAAAAAQPREDAEAARGAGAYGHAEWQGGRGGATRGYAHSGTGLRRVPRGQRCPHPRARLGPQAEAAGTSRQGTWANLERLAEGLRVPTRASVAGCPTRARARGSCPPAPKWRQMARRRRHCYAEEHAGAPPGARGRSTRRHAHSRGGPKPRKGARKRRQRTAESAPCGGGWRHVVGDSGGTVPAPPGPTATPRRRRPRRDRVTEKSCVCFQETKL